MDLVSVEPRLNLYNELWPIRGAQPGVGPCKFVFADDEDGRMGLALDSIVGAGTIVSGGQLERSVCSHQVRVHSFAEVEECVLFPRVEVGRGRAPAPLHRRQGRAHPGRRGDRLRPRARSRALHGERGRRGRGHARAPRPARRVRRLVAGAQRRSGTRRRETARQPLRLRVRVGGAGAAAAHRRSGRRRRGSRAGARRARSRGDVSAAGLARRTAERMRERGSRRLRARGARTAASAGARAGRWLAGRVGDVQVELLDLPGLFDRETPYGGADEGAALRRLLARRRGALRGAAPRRAGRARLARGARRLRPAYALRRRAGARDRQRAGGAQRRPPGPLPRRACSPPPASPPSCSGRTGSSSTAICAC